jgi:outer membrane protein OmpA-like peptidoglycan-associated protein
MIITKLQKASLSALALGVALVASAAQLSAQGAAMPQDKSAAASQGVRNVANGQKANFKGVIVRREDDQTWVVRDETNTDTLVALDPATSIKSKGGFFGGGKSYSPASLLRGLNVEIEGRGDAQGRVVAKKIRFSDSDYRVARSLETRIDPVEGRVQGAEGRLSQVEENARRTSGQLDELLAVSNAARGGAKAAQETADAAVAGVNRTNERISALDEYTPQDVAMINFKTGSAALSLEAKAQLDGLAAKAISLRGYVIEVTGYTDSVGSVERNRVLSQRRAEAVIRYLLDNHQIPLRRIVPSYGYGENNAVADNTTREGRAQNRRVEVKILVSKGITQSGPDMPKPADPQQ